MSGLGLEEPVHALQASGHAASGAAVQSAVHSKRPRVLMYATVPALAAWKRLGVQGVLEVEVARGILAGDVQAGKGGGFVFGRSWVARCVRVDGRLRPKPRAWQVVEVERRRS